MPRHARKKSGSGFYHVIIRGIGKQILFEDRQDYLHFKETLKRFIESCSVEIHAYCMMENHVHLLLRDINGEMDVFMKRLEGSYAYYYNHKYERAGILFQNRFMSEPIDNDAYFAVVLRYILQNPVKAGTGTVTGYPWSSYGEMANKSEAGKPEAGRSDWLTTAFAENFFGDRKALLDYVCEPGSEACMEPAKPPVNDRRARQIICETLSIASGTQLQQYDRADRDRALRILKENGLSVRQIERLTGINRGIVLKA